MSMLKDKVKEYLDQRAQTDELFGISYAKENKNIDECCTYLTDRAEKEFGAGGHFVEPDIVFGWAVHYYDEDDIKVKDTSSMPVNNATIKQTDDKKETPKAKIKPKKKEDVGQLSLFLK